MREQMVRASMTRNGRVVIPVAYRRALGLGEGGEVVLRLKDGYVAVEPLARSVEAAREAVQGYAGGRDLAAELLRERCEESERG